MRYIDPGDSIRGRLEDAGDPGWEAAVICFRDLGLPHDRLAIRGGPGESEAAVGNGAVH